MSSPLAVLMVDLDHFKRVNDLYGHPTGDRLLVRVARFLEEAVRAEDVVARYGGEEFVVVLSGTREEDARWVAEKLCESAQELLGAADEALYRAKRDGRDRVVTASELAVPELLDEAG
jgi:PleD family two-component response regulator